MWGGKGNKEARKRENSGEVSQGKKLKRETGEAKKEGGVEVEKWEWLKGGRIRRKYRTGRWA